ncbi:secG [Symbiodinium pilosum]|uniref:SecG protein n=1 Tax=Symbiodinium pilosum TaxID=2952 RepID=A0A812VG33_SYMPI|nr:secG [Symbiodinium pilosum]
MRLLLFATFMTWRFRLVNESSQQLRRAIADREAQQLVLGGISFCRLSTGGVDVATCGSGCLKTSRQMDAPHPQREDVTSNISMQIFAGALRTAYFEFGSLLGCLKARLLARRAGLPWDLPQEEDGRLLSLDRLWAAIRARPEAVNTATPEGKPLTVAVKKGKRDAVALQTLGAAAEEWGCADLCWTSSSTTPQLEALLLPAVTGILEVSGNLEALQLLLFEASGHGGTPLDVAVSRNQQECVQLLLDAGGRHSLHRAAELAVPVMVRAWLNEGADVEERDSSGATPLLLAAKGAGRTAERTECIKLLLCADAMVDALPITQETPLMHAAAQGIRQHCELLLEARADCQLRDRRNRQPIDHATKQD